MAKLRTWEHLLLGGLSGATAASATMPLDFAKTVLQTGTSSQPIQAVFATQLREKGVGGLFAGMVRAPGPFSCAFQNSNSVKKTADMTAVCVTRGPCAQAARAVTPPARGAQPLQASGTRRGAARERLEDSPAWLGSPSA